jgi:hypothetical protein
MEDASPRSELGEILTSEMGDILDIVSHNHIPTMILRVPSLVIVAASPGAHELLDPLAQPLIGHSLRDFTKSHPSGAMPLLESGRITGYDAIPIECERASSRSRFVLANLSRIRVVERPRRGLVGQALGRCKDSVSLQASQAAPMMPAEFWS